MRQISKTDFTGLPSIELATLDEVLEIVSKKTVIGYFVPASAWADIRSAITCIEWDDLDELGPVVRGMVQDTPQ